MMGLTQVRADALNARLARLGAPAGAFGAARAAALARLQAAGLPGRRDEYWRYTDPAALNAADPVSAAVFDNRADTLAFQTLDRLKIVFTDGVFDAASSDPLELSGIEITRLAEATPGHWAESVYGTLETAAQSPVARPLAALNTAFARDGVLIRARGKVARPVSLIYRHRAETSDAMLHNVIVLEPGAELTLLENGPAAARFSNVTEVVLGDESAFHHVRVQGRDPDRRAVTHLIARLGRAARLKSFTLTANGKLTRNEAVIEMLGQGGIAHVAGAAMADGAFLHDDTVFITHQGEACESRQVFKKVLMNGAIGVFQGKILVKQSAQKTDGYQISQSLLLDETSQFNAKPELEIYADDVKCSHGSTSGAIDDTALFYLRSRGVPAVQAKALLVLAFLHQALDEIEDDTLREDVRARMEAWMSVHGH
jgi:Fe-S cluster assembly protein SufD